MGTLNLGVYSKERGSFFTIVITTKFENPSASLAGSIFVPFHKLRRPPIPVAS